MDESQLRSLVSAAAMVWICCLGSGVLPMARPCRGFRDGCRGRLDRFAAHSSKLRRLLPRAACLFSGAPELGAAVRRGFCELPTSCRTEVASIRGEELVGAVCDPPSDHLYAPAESEWVQKYRKNVKLVL